MTIINGKIYLILKALRFKAKEGKKTMTKKPNIFMINVYRLFQRLNISIERMLLILILRFNLRAICS